MVELRTVLYTKKRTVQDPLAKAARSITTRNVRRQTRRTPQSRTGQLSSEEAIRAGEQIAMAAFASGLKLAAAFGTVAAKTAGLALASLASGADKFSELVREEAKKSYKAQIVDNHNVHSIQRVSTKAKSRRKRA